MNYREHPQFSELQALLIDHYKRFKRQTFWLDQFPCDKSYVAVCSSVRDNSPVRLHFWIARFIKRQLVDWEIKVNEIHIGPYVWEWETLHAS